MSLKNYIKHSFLLLLIFHLFLCIPIHAQNVYTLEQCRELALRNNKQLMVSRVGLDVADNLEKAAKTKYLPHVNGMAGYEHFSKEVFILNKEQKSALSNIGTHTVGSLGNELGNVLTSLATQGIISPEMAQQLGAQLQSFATPLAKAGNELGETIREAFRTDTRNIWAANISVVQPIYMGGGITAANEIAKLGKDMAQNHVENTRQTTLYAIDNAYWLAISLKNKERLAKDFLDLVKKLNSDVHKLINEGVATRADGLKVDVAENTAEMTVTQVENGVSLAKMLLCQLCGLPMDGNIKLADENKDNIAGTFVESVTVTDSTHSNRPEVRLLQNAIDISEQNTKLVQAIYRPHVALTGGLTVSNPNTFNGFEKRFAGVWNIGVLVQMPIWNWHEGRYKTNASRAATQIAQLELCDVQEKINLQIEQCKFKLTQAQKSLISARKNMASADENLRCANIGFKEGVMTVTDVMAAQTAWQKAQSQKVDAEIEVRLAKVSLQKALGEL